MGRRADLEPCLVAAYCEGFTEKLCDKDTPLPFLVFLPFFHSPYLYYCLLYFQPSLQRISVPLRPSYAHHKPSLNHQTPPTSTLIPGSPDWADTWHTIPHPINIKTDEEVNYLTGKSAPLVVVRLVEVALSVPSTLTSPFLNPPFHLITESYISAPGPLPHPFSSSSSSDRQNARRG